MFWIVVICLKIVFRLKVIYFNKECTHLYNLLAIVKCSTSGLLLYLSLLTILKPSDQLTLIKLSNDVFMNSYCQSLLVIQPTFQTTPNLVRPRNPTPTWAWPIKTLRKRLHKTLRSRPANSASNRPPIGLKLGLQSASNSASNRPQTRPPIGLKLSLQSASSGI